MFFKLKMENRELTEENKNLTIQLAKAYGERGRLRLSNMQKAEELKKLKEENAELKKERDRLLDEKKKAVAACRKYRENLQANKQNFANRMDNLLDELCKMGEAYATLKSNHDALEYTYSEEVKHGIKIQNDFERAEGELNAYKELFSKATKSGGEDRPSTAEE